LSGAPYIALLTRLITGVEQQNHTATANDKLNPVTLTDENTHLAHTAAHRLDIAQVTLGGPNQATGDGPGRLPVFQLRLPFQ